MAWPRLPFQHVAEREQGVSLGNDAAADRCRRNWTVVGYPIGGIWAKPIVGYADKNGDGILTVDEVTIRSDTLFSDTVDPVTGKRATIGVGTFRGYAEPRYLTTFTPGIDLFRHRLRIQSLFDWRGGNT